VREGSPAASILGHLEGITMIAMTTRGHSGFARALFGSVADEVIRLSHLPVLVIHPPS
jgi:nucleotide-binding universal stress UspA family protein